ncbi:variable surface protein Vir17, putative [Plasmodium vivax]|uniref:Variable surface protein Vir17, putative n=1 Tax=Plasmodium vivax (strain Salvador I) TaxID=126793 RepID=A5KCZ9_PLAVS|nr:variable surface protein Vir17, putative [Plasmodium vivax]EDL42769.1 variable surface protein Vir17, putative [Plasmodium vivax]|eukprot:XP_001612562.1 variable surface protein Vir17 [Plasmodium vivax Sal-1]
MFIEQIKNFNYNNQTFCTIDDLTDIRAEENDALTNIGCTLYKGYRRLTAYDDENREIFCDYLNLWLDEKKSTHTTDKSDVIIEKWILIEKLWNKLYEIEDPSRKCKRQEDGFDVYCVNRDYFKDLCKKAIEKNSNVEKDCSLFSEFINKSYAEFFDENRCFDDPLDSDNYGYSISDDCDLSNIAKTFPKYDSTRQTILDNDNLKATIKRCVIPPKVEDGNSEPSVEVADVPPETSEPGKVLTESEDALTESKFRHPGQEVDLAVPPVLFHPPSADANLTDNGHSKPIYYAGLSLSGVFFTSMVLYKYTALGPLIRSLVSKKEKLRQTTNKHLAQQWLERTSEYMDSNSENSHYNFPYQSMQN